MIAICIIGFLIALVFAVASFYYRKVQIIRRSQPIFVYIFLFGAAFLNTCILVHIGPNTDLMCGLRPWLFNTAATTMFAPLIMKLHRVDLLFNNPKLRKIKVSDFDVIIRVLCLLAIDVFLLIIWSSVSSVSPYSITKSTEYTGALKPVDDVVCNTGFNSPMEIVMLVYKSLLIAFGVYKAATTWKIPADVSEAKFFAGAIYNIVFIGGLCYFLGDYLKQSNVQIGVLLQCLGMFISASIAVIVIMLFKIFNASKQAGKIDDESNRSSSNVSSNRFTSENVSTTDPDRVGFIG